MHVSHQPTKIGLSRHPFTGDSFSARIEIEYAQGYGMWG